MCIGLVFIYGIDSFVNSFYVVVVFQCVPFEQKSRLSILLKNMTKVVPRYVRIIN